MISQEELKKLFHYDPLTGIFTRVVGCKGVKPNTTLKRKTDSGYLVTTHKKETYRLHRLAFLYMTGIWPSKFVDHIDGNKDNNVWSNLRECTKSQNGHNVGIKSTNTSGCKGVSFRKDRGKWRSYLRVDGRIRHLGYFEDYETAELVATEARNLFHGEFARHA